jgi:hypothetical protein
MHRSAATPGVRHPNGRPGLLGSCPSLYLGSEHDSVVGFPQAALLASYEGIDPAGVLRSTRVTPLRRYYGPLRLPATPGDGYWFPPSVGPSPCPGDVPRGRVSQVPRGSVDARCPLSPRAAHPLHVLVASRMVSDFIISGSLTAADWCNEAGMGSLALRLTSSPPRAPTARLPAPPPSRLHGERAIAMVSTFQLTRSTRLCLAHRNTRKFKSKILYI